MSSTTPPSTLRSLFYGFGAWVGRLDSRTACAWWADDPNHLGFDPNLLNPVNLARSPRAYRDGVIGLDEIQVDDSPSDGGLTKLGPTWPTGSTIQGVWLEASFHSKLPTPPPFPQSFMDCEAYELMTAIYWSVGREIARRVWGFHAEITAEHGSLALCTIWTPGTSRSRRPAGSWWIDLGAQADPIANGLTAIGVGPAPKVGALFLDAHAARSLALAGPKLPPWAGEQSIPLPTTR